MIRNECKGLVRVILDSHVYYTANMAATMQTAMMRKLSQIYLVFCLILHVSVCEANLYQFKPDDINSAIDSVCLLLVDINAEQSLMDKFTQLKDIFAQEDSVYIGKADIAGFAWSNGEALYWRPSDIPVNYQTKDIAFFPKKKVDRTCLYHPNQELEPMAEYFTGPAEVTTLVQFINSKCNTFLQPNGFLTIPGMHRQSILSNLFQTSEISDVTIAKIYSSNSNPFHNSAQFVHPKHDILKQQQCDGMSCKEEDENRYKKSEEVKVTSCERISLPLDKDSFFSNYVSRSRPVIISGAAKQWPAFNKWSMEYLRELYGNETVHIKLTPGGDFEGVEPIDLWENHQEFSIPKMVYEALKFPDLVVVRPAGVSMKFGEFLDLITWAAEQESRNVSAYLEYSSIPDYMPKLKEDLEEFTFAQFLKLKHLNIWLSDGNTLGRLHFDPFDNLLCQVNDQFCLCAS